MIQFSESEISRRLKRRTYRKFVPFIDTMARWDLMADTRNEAVRNLKKNWRHHGGPGEMDSWRKWVAWNKKHNLMTLTIRIAKITTGNA